MIIAIAAGQAGNQMFQLGGIESVLTRPTEKIILVNFSELETILPSLGKYARLVLMPEWLGNIYPYIDSIMRRLARWKILGSVVQVDPNSPRIARHHGVLPFTMFWGGYCQDENVVATGILEHLYFEDVLEADDLLEAIQTAPADYEAIRCFIHVRRGDYVSHPTPETSATLPFDWFLSAMDTLRSKQPSVLFFVLSDDPVWAREHFSELVDTQVMDLGSRAAFAFMSQCDAGILSPSTFSWWAAFFASKGSGLPFVAPLFWTGWRSGYWHPHESIKATFLSYAEVSAELGEAGNRSSGV